MPLITCPDCGKEISDQAPACPNCGRPGPFEASAIVGPTADTTTTDGPRVATGPSLDTILGLAKTAAAAGNVTEAEKYFTQALEQDPTISEAWVGKGKAAGWQSTIVNMRLTEMLVNFGHAIATAPENEKAAIKDECIGEVNAVITALYDMARKHMLEFISLSNTWTSYIDQIKMMLITLGEVAIWDGTNKTTLENIVFLCKDNIEGVTYKDQFDNNTPKAWHLSPEYEAIVREQLNAAAEMLQKLDPQYVPPNPQAKAPESSCFVVTATMGGPQHPTVVLMRDFRDQYLLRTKTGAAFVRFYYRHGPKAADFIRHSMVRRKLSYFFIVAPAAWLARKVLNSRS